MGLFSTIFKRQQDRPAPGKASLAADESLVERARTSARRRLIGAVLLLGVGVVAFPLIFETQPRPIPVDIPIEIARKEGLPPLALPASRPATAAPRTASAPAAGGESKPATATVVASAPAAAPAPAPPPPPAAAPKVEAKPAPKVEAKPAAAPATAPVAEAAGRFVVQVGAFADAAVVRETRGKVGKLGLATYTQVVDTANGQRTRVRIGPFATRDEADQAAAKLKAAGLPGAVLAL